MVFGRTGNPRLLGSGRHSRRWGEIGCRSRRGRPDPRNDRSPILKTFEPRKDCNHVSSELPAYPNLPTLGFLVHAFWAGRESLIFGVWAAPGAREAIRKCGGLRPPYF